MIEVSLSKLGIVIIEHFGTQGQENVSYLKKNTRKFQANSKLNSLKATSGLMQQMVQALRIVVNVT